MRNPVLAAMALASTLACAGGESGPPAEELIGTWQATRHRYVAVEDGATVDLIPGGTGVLVLNADRSGTYTYTPDEEGAEVRVFTWSQDGENLTWQYGPGNDDNFKVALEGGTLSLSLNGVKGYDVNGDGTGETCRWTLAFTR
jgi:hypothetical protein